MCHRSDVSVSVTTFLPFIDALVWLCSLSMHQWAVPCHAMLYHSDCPPHNNKICSTWIIEVFCFAAHLIGFGWEVAQWCDVPCWFRVVLMIGEKWFFTRYSLTFAILSCNFIYFHLFCFRLLIFIWPHSPRLTRLGLLFWSIGNSLLFCWC